jgi:hypothetical protein
MLRRDLSGVVRVAASLAYRASWEVLESLEDSLNSRTRRSLAARAFDLRRPSSAPCNVHSVCEVIEGAGPNGVPGRPGGREERLRGRGQLRG